MALQDFCYIFGCASPCSSLSGNFVEWARQVKVDSTIYMIRIDIKHFFMSGTPEHLAEYASRILPQGHRRIYHDAVLWFLHNQYIKSGVIKHSTVFKVVRGAGMGLPASGPITDSVFYFVREILGQKPSGYGSPWHSPLRQIQRRSFRYCYESGPNTKVVQRFMPCCLNGL